MTCINWCKSIFISNFKQELEKSPRYTRYGNRTINNVNFFKVIDMKGIFKTASSKKHGIWIYNSPS